jgi:transposase
MNKHENTLSTTESGDELRMEPKITDEKTLALLKLVYQDKKSIKQSSKYLNINYNTAKRLIKNFRKNKVNLGHKNMDGYLNLVEDLEVKSFKSPYQEERKNINKEQGFFGVVMTQIKQCDIQLKILNDEIKNNQMMMFYLTNCANRMIEAMKTHQV